MKKIIFIVVAIIVLIVAYYLISPLWRNIELDEDIPGLENIKSEDGEKTMSPEKQIIYDKEMEKMENVVMEKKEEMPSMTTMTSADKPNSTNEVTQTPKKSEDTLTILKEGVMTPSSYSVEGVAKIIDIGESNILRFENLNTINGPDLRIYLSAGLDVKDAVDLGAIRATKGNVNYTIPDGTDVEKYNKVLIWCRAFSKLFSYSELK